MRFNISIGELVVQGVNGDVFTNADQLCALLEVNSCSFSNQETFKWC